MGLNRVRWDLQLVWTRRKQIEPGWVPNWIPIQCCPKKQKNCKNSTQFNMKWKFPSLLSSTDTNYDLKKTKEALIKKVFAKIYEQNNKMTFELFLETGQTMNVKLYIGKDL